MIALDCGFVRVPTRAVLIIAVLLLAGLVVGLSGRDALAHAGHGKPARLQQGTCAEIGPVAFELTGVGATEDHDGNAIPEPEIIGAASASRIEASVTIVPAALDTIVSGGHAIVVYLSDDAMDVTVACGDVGGIVVREDLVVGLAAEGEDGMSGIALFRAEGESTVVSVFMSTVEHEHGDEEAATPAA